MKNNKNVQQTNKILAVITGVGIDESSEWKRGMVIALINILLSIVNIANQNYLFAGFFLLVGMILFGMAVKDKQIYDEEIYKGNSDEKNKRTRTSD